METAALLMELTQHVILENKGIVTLETLRNIQRRHREDYPDLFYAVRVLTDFTLRHGFRKEEDAVRALLILLGDIRSELATLVGPRSADQRLRAMATPIIQARRELFGQHGLGARLPDPFREVYESVQRDHTFLAGLRGLSEEETARTIFERLYTGLLQGCMAAGLSDLSPFRSFLRQAGASEQLLEGFRLADDGSVILFGSLTPVPRAVGVLGRLYDYWVDLAAEVLGRAETINIATRNAAGVLLPAPDQPAPLGILKTVLSGALSPTVALGVPGLDEVIGGEVKRGSAILLVGPSVMEQRFLLWNFIRRGLAHGEGVMVVWSQGPGEQVSRHLLDSWTDPAPYLQKKNLRLLDWYSLRGTPAREPRVEGLILRVPPNMLSLNQAVLAVLQDPGPAFAFRGVLECVDPALREWEPVGATRFLGRLMDRLRKAGYTTLSTAPADLPAETLGLLMPIYDYVLDLSLRRFGGDPVYAIGSLKPGLRTTASMELVRHPLILDGTTIRVGTPANVQKGDEATRG